MRGNKWRRFERLAAAIRNAEQNGVPVKWNTRIAGHRFDAAVSPGYQHGEYLIVVNCVEGNTPVTAARVKSFAKTVEAAGAHLGIMASTSDYSQDAFELTAKHSVALLSGTILNEMSERQLRDTFKLALSIYDFRFVPADGSVELGIPEEPALLRSMMRDIKLKGPGIDTVPERLVEEANEELVQTAVGKPQRYEVALPPGTMLIHPNTEDKKRVTTFAFTYRLVPASVMAVTDGVEDDPYLIEHELKEELAKRNPAADPSNIDKGFDTKLRASRYYYNPRVQFSYFCEEVKKGQATVVLVESYQNGNLLQARMRIAEEFHKQFVEVTERGEIDRLAKIYERYAVSDKNLEGRFKVFLGEFEGAESIDDLTLTPEQQRANKADYFFEGRSIVGELKALYTDTAPKVEAILAPHRERPEWPIFYGEQELQKILRHLPDRDELNAKIIQAITDSIERVVEKANRQIRDTKETFGLPEVGGLLIILNDVVDMLSPELVTYRVRRSLNKRTPDGELRFPHVSAVLLIGGTHYTQMTPTLKGIPTLLMPNTVPEAGKVEEFVRALNSKWASFEGTPLFHVDTETLPDLKFSKFSDDAREPPRPLTRQDSWSIEYHLSPYLRPLSEEKFLEFGERVFEELSSRMIKGAPKTPKEEMLPLMMRWSHFLDEVKYRGLDMRKFIMKMDGLGERLEELYQQYQQQNEGDS